MLKTQVFNPGLPEKARSIMTDVFISYSRKDKEFGFKLHDALTSRGKDTFIDLQDIPPAVDFLDEIYVQIENAIAFVFIISPDSVVSEACRKEIEYAQKRSKLLIPILRRTDSGMAVPSPMKDLNWIFFRDEDDFSASLDLLIKAIDIDYAWARKHAKYEKRAMDWETQKYDDSLVLRGRDLREAEEWFAQSISIPTAHPTELQVKYISASRTSAIKRQRLILGAVSFAMVVALILAGLATYQWNVAVEQRNLALARQLGSQAELLRQQEPGLFQTSVLLAIESLKRVPTLQGDKALRLDLAILPEPVARMHIYPRNINGSEQQISAIAFSPNGKWLAAGSLGEVVTLWDTDTWTEKRILPGASGGTVPQVRSLAFSPDSQRLAIGLDGGGLIWDAKEQREVARFGSGQIFSLAFTPDGTRIVSTADNIVTVSDSTTGKALYTLEGGGNVVGLSPDGNLAAAGGGDSIIVWNVKSGSVLTTKQQVFKNPNADDIGLAITTLAFSPDGKRIATGEGLRFVTVFPRIPASGEILIWDPLTGKDIAEVNVAEETMGLQFSPDSRQLAAGVADGFVYLWDAATGVQLNAIQSGSNVINAIFLADGRRLAYTDAFGTAKVVDSQTGSEIARMPTEVQTSLTALAASNPADLIAVGDENGNIWVWKLRGQETAKVGTGPGVSISTVSFSPDGKRILLGAWDRTVRVADAITGEQTIVITHTNRVLIAHFDPTGQIVASGSQDGQVQVWNSLSGQLIFQSSIGQKLGDLTFSPDGKWLAASEGSFPRDAWFIYKRQPSGNPTDVIIWETRTGKEIARLPHADLVNSLAFSPDGQRIVTAGDDNLVHVWDIKSQKEIFQVQHQNRVNLVTISSDGKRGASAESCFQTGPTFPQPCSPFIKVWDTSSGQLIWQQQLAAPWVSNLLFSPDGQRLATTNDYIQGCPTSKCELAVQVWDANTGRLVSKMVHGEVIIALAISPDGRQLASGGSDGTLRIWNPANGEETAHITGIGSPWSASFSSDNRSILVGGYEGGVSYARVLPVAATPLIEMACQRLTRNLTMAEWKQYLSDIPFQTTCSGVGTFKDTRKPNGDSTHPLFSQDGKFIVFQSSATNLVCGLSNQHSQIYLYNRETGQIELVSVSSDGEPANADASFSEISADGRWVLFESNASNLVPRQNQSEIIGEMFYQLYLYDRTTKRTELLSINATRQPANGNIVSVQSSADWRWFVFESKASNLVSNLKPINSANDQNYQIYLYDRTTRQFELISRTPNGQFATGESTDPIISADGRYIVFKSSAPLLPDQNQAKQENIYLYDRKNQKYSLVTRTRDVQSTSEDMFRVGTLLSDGTGVTFSSSATNLDVATRSVSGYYRYDFATGQISPTSQFDGVWSADWDPDIKSQTFYGTTQVLYKNSDTGIKKMISTAPDGDSGNDMSQDASITDDKQFIAFTSLASNLVAGDTNGYADIFGWDAAVQHLERISMGVHGQQGNGHSYQPAMSRDGRWVAFASNAKNLIEVDQSEHQELFVYDRLSQTISRITEATLCQP
jgi:WD40 repeat protein